MEENGGEPIGRKIKVLQFDNGTKCRNGQFSYFYKKEGISRHFKVRDTSQQNGVVERMNRTLLEKFGVCCPMLVWANRSGLRLLCMQVISLTVYH